MKKFWNEHKAHIIVLASLCGHQLTVALINTETGEHFYFVLEVCRLIFLGG